MPIILSPLFPGSVPTPIANTTAGGCQPKSSGKRLPAAPKITVPSPGVRTLGPENANYYSSQDIFEKTFGKQGSTAPVGFYNGSVYDDFITSDSPSPYGLYDMAGNVWQWTGDVYENQHYRYMRGGSKDTYGYNLRVWTRNSAGPEYYSPAVGFRCARNSQ